MKFNTFTSSKKKNAGADRASDSDSESEFQSIVDHESAIHELYEKRLELSLGEAEVHEFTWQLRGGKWTMPNKGSLMMLSWHRPTRAWPSKGVRNTR